MKKFMVFLALLLMTSCTLFMKSPEVDLKGIKITGLDRSGLHMELALAVTNPNGSKLTLQGYRYDLQLLSVPLARGEIRRQMDFLPNTTCEVVVPVSLPYGAVADILQKQPNPDRIPYSLTSTFDLDTAFGAVTVPYSKTGSFSIPEKFRQSSLINLLNGLLEGVRK